MKPNRRKPVAEINVVPYIDVMLVLLVIFMITAPLITAGVNVDLPQADADPISANDDPPLIASIDASGNYYLSLGVNPDQALEPEELVALVAKHRETNPKAMIYINADKAVSHGSVVLLMSLLQKQAGVANVGIMTDPTG
ncbi:protein TolR [Pleionea mediterranea]|jgi:biopolymer transport protein TolR|uniref:Tol-Pal system protein TolR n=1 Tax=Pleionea mediterranea TaxID=523701 RepID=A0A316G343_9GAMM|nr:protein TolR [Pleionea mediterranea]PWK54220.1 cell division and transport-associated protein TolR [Pleionea mediterranea]